MLTKPAPAVILVVNKWDKISKDSYTMKAYEEQVRTKIRYLDYAPLIFISAETGQRLPKLFSLIDAVAQARRVRVGTGELNSFLQKAALNKAAIPANKQVKVHYMTQVGTAPPVFALVHQPAKQDSFFAGTLPHQSNS